ncbi:MAG: methionyl-tRNA formyltransferase [Gammaproteobacteria bacterium]|jgi:methionyl-tRNA formyltransferase|nr:methionyl-tRNA formyltransferase [Gammaproteobacteria bacterium]
MTRARIVFAGSPEFAVPALTAVLDSPHEVVAVLTQPDRPAGRGRRLTPSPVHQAAAARGLRILQPLSLRESLIQAQLRALTADLLVVVAYGQLLPPEVLAMPRRGCVNLHASLLPRWRGASPIQSALLAGDTETGVCLMQMDAGLDTGAVFARSVRGIAADATAASLHDALAADGATLLATHLDELLAGSLAAVPQSKTGVTYAPRIKKADGVIDWQQPAARIDCQIRAYNPWPVATTVWQGQPLRCWNSRLAVDDPSASPTAAVPGEVVAVGAAGIGVQTGAGIVLLTELQLPGKRRLSAGQFSQAHALAGSVLGS